MIKSDTNEYARQSGETCARRKEGINNCTYKPTDPLWKEWVQSYCDYKTCKIIERQGKYSRENIK